MNKLRGSVEDCRRISKDDLIAQSSSTPINEMLQRYQSKVEDTVQDAKRFNYQRMENQSAYVTNKGYKCGAIANQLKQTSRKRAIQDQCHVSFETNLAKGPRRSISSLQTLVGLQSQKPLPVMRQEPIVNTTGFIRNIPTRNLDSKQKLELSNINNPQASLAQIKQNYFRIEQEQLERMKDSQRNSISSMASASNM